MKICVAQTRPVKGNVQSNINSHKCIIELAVSNGAVIIIFPELSLTGYEPELAKGLATVPDDSRFDDFQKMSDLYHITIGAGVPTLSDKGTCITMVLFQPGQVRETYSKKYLHADEEGFFVTGKSTVDFIGENNSIALAICYELSVAEHAENAFKNGAEIYIVSAVKSNNGIDNAIKRLADIARNYSMTVLLSNCVGNCGGEVCAGKTAIWNSSGLLLEQLDDINEGILIIDTATQEIIKSDIKL